MVVNRLTDRCCVGEAITGSDVQELDDFHGDKKGDGHQVGEKDPKREKVEKPVVDNGDVHR